MDRDNLPLEFLRRQAMWNDLLKQGGPQNVSAKLLGQLRIYGGGAGIWVDKATTGKRIENESGITVSLTHSGKSYPDDFSETEVIYHYPQTSHPKGRDITEIEATKNAAMLGFPVFVITHTNHSTREVRLGFVTDWDDATKRFLVTFTQQFPNNLLTTTNDYRLIGLTPIRDEVTSTNTRIREVPEDVPFVLFNNEKGKQRLVNSRKNQAHFKFYVVKRYGLTCAVCGLDVEDFLQAAAPLFLKNTMVLMTPEMALFFAPITTLHSITVISLFIQKA